MGETSEQTCLQRKHTTGPQTLKKMLSFTLYSEIAHENHKDKAPHNCENNKDK